MTIFSKKLAPTRFMKKNGSHRIERLKFLIMVCFLIFGKFKSDYKKRLTRTFSFQFLYLLFLKRKEKESKGVLRFKWFHQNFF